MITLTFNLPQEVEQELEKDLKYLEKTTKKPREYHIKEALVRYIEEVINYPNEVKEVEKYRKKNNLSYEYHIREALVRYIEDMEDIRDYKKYLKRKEEGKVKYYTSEELNKRLGIDE